LFFLEKKCPSKSGKIFFFLSAPFDAVGITGCAVVCGNDNVVNAVVDVTVVGDAVGVDNVVVATTSDQLSQMLSYNGFLGNFK